MRFVADFSCVSLENRLGGSLAIGSVATFPLGELETKSVGSVLVEVGVKIQVLDPQSNQIEVIRQVGFQIYNALIQNVFFSFPFHNAFLRIEQNLIMFRLA